ncbi:hypothetical protein BKI52_26655 [marine bacterium AO1-C]|nr:hypothetical protein BKI52_26655 [marine bacterium AO1-C]
MNHSQISFSTGIGLAIFSTILFGGSTVLGIFLSIKAIMKPSQGYLLSFLSALILFAVYYFLLFWTTIKVPNRQTLELTTKTVFGSKTKRYENITKVKLFHVPKGGYAIRIYQQGVKDYAFKGGFSHKNAKALADLFHKTDLPLETKLFQER